MPKIICFLLLIAFLGCKKDKDGSGLRLKAITANNATTQTFEYQNGLLTKENHYMFCSVPSDEHVYVYQDSRLVKIQSTIRSYYSSTTAICDPAAGQHMEDQYEYDILGRLSRINRQASYTLFTYNSRDLVEKVELFNTAGTLVNSGTYVYDLRGNLVKETDFQGMETLYEYDNKMNPFYLMKQKPGWISAFNTSPNNVIRGTNAWGGFVRNIKTYWNDLPLTVEENGVEYTYVY
jgi:hypothetical protein